MTVLVEDDLREIVKRVFQARFPKVNVVTVKLKEIDDDEDQDGVEVQIIFEAKKGSFRPEAIPDFMDDIIGAWNKTSQSRFPIVSFIAKSDLGNRKTAAA